MDFAGIPHVHVEIHGGSHFGHGVHTAHSLLGDKLLTKVGVLVLIAVIAIATIRVKIRKEG